MSQDKETLDIPQALRDAVDERDKGHCRLCGKFIGGRRAIHHIFFGGDLQGIGGRRHHALNNLVSLCWLPFDNDCHQLAHSQKDVWQPLLQAVITRPANTTALALRRYARREGTR